jgi:hypothetical protein
MLEYLDALIGLAAIMLGLSLVVTIVNQMISSLLGLRGRNLQWGLTLLVHNLHQGTELPADVKLSEGVKPSGDLVKAIEDILVHPLVSDSAFTWFKPWKLASAIRYDEFIKMIGMLGDLPASAPVMKWLRENHKITPTWFDSVMDRASQRFAMHMRVAGGAIAFVLVVSMQIDTLDIVNHLRGDQQMRLNFVAVADSVNKLGQTLPQGDPNREQLSQIAQSMLSPLRNQTMNQTIGSILNRPRPGEVFFGTADGNLDWRHLAGVLLSGALLTLGAPFWFNALKSLTGLRSVVARKEQDERQQRQATPDAGDGIQWVDAK